MPCEQVAALGLAVLRGDMPRIGSTTHGYLCAKANRSNIAQPRYRGYSAHPLWFGQDFWPALPGLDGDSGAPEFLREHAAPAVEGPGIHLDIDTPADLRLTAPREIFQDDAERTKRCGQRSSSG